MLDILYWLVYGFFQAFVGLLFTVRDPATRKLQRWGGLFFGLFVCAWVAAFVIPCLSWSSFGWLLGGGAVSLAVAAYLGHRVEQFQRAERLNANKAAATEASRSPGNP